jgi:septation ring formation regulator EzrA
MKVKCLLIQYKKNSTEIHEIDESFTKSRKRLPKKRGENEERVPDSIDKVRSK